MDHQHIRPSENPHGVTINAILWLLTALAGICLGLRIYCKSTRGRSLWWDDYFILAAWTVLLASCIATTANVTLGFGLHLVDVPAQNLLTMGILSNVSGFTSVLGVALSKTSFAITLLRLTDGWMRWFIWVLLVVLNATQYTSAAFFWVSCDPPAKTWNPTLEGTCWPAQVNTVFSVVTGAWSAFCDLSLALLPWRLLLQFHMYRKEKIGVALAMSMGIFAGITCIVKITTIPLLAGSDFTYSGTPLVLWGFAEVACTIIAASIPTLRALFATPSWAPELPSLRVHLTNQAAAATTSNRPDPKVENQFFEKIQSNKDGAVTYEMHTVGKSDV